MPAPVTITRSEFEWWAQDAMGLRKPPSVRALAKVSGISKSTLSYQLNAGSVPAASVIKISRGLGNSPLEDLASFAGFEGLQLPAAPPTQAELLTLISPRDILLESARRLGVQIDSWQIDDFLPGKSVWSPWFKTVAPKATYAAVKGLVGISETQIANNHRESSWSVEQLALMGQEFDFSIPMALVVSGNLNFCEVGLSPNIRQAALVEASDEELQARSEKVTASLAETIRKSVEDRPKHVILEYLG